MGLGGRGQQRWKGRTPDITVADQTRQSDSSSISVVSLAARAILSLPPVLPLHYCNYTAITSRDTILLSARQLEPNHPHLHLRTIPHQSFQICVPVSNILPRNRNPSNRFYRDNGQFYGIHEMLSIYHSCQMNWKTSQHRCVLFRPCSCYSLACKQAGPAIYPSSNLQNTPSHRRRANQLEAFAVDPPVVLHFRSLY